MCFSGGAILAYVVTDGRLFSHKTGVWLTLLGHRGILLRRVAHGRKIAMRLLLFPGYVFVCIISRGHAAAGCPALLVLSWAANARRACPDAVISELKGRERNGVIAFPEKPQPALFRTNERLQVRTGPLAVARALRDRAA